MAIVKKEFYYKVAGHLFWLTASNRLDCFTHYDPFLVDSLSKNELFHLTIKTEKENIQIEERGESEQIEPDRQIGYFDDDTAAIGVYARKNGGYLFCIALPGGERCCVMTTSADYKSADVCFEGDTRSHSFGLDNCLMLLYAFASASEQTLMMHTSVVKHKGIGYLFLGKSGTGKSTHSRLWLEHIEGCELLNDDNPIVRITDGKVMVYGSPWSGKTPCYKNESAAIGGFVRLQQKPENRIELLSMAQAFAALKPSCSTAPWDNMVHDGICNTLITLLQQVNTYALGCLPNKEAALLCHQTIAR